ncbi:LysR family transcriptional regulator [Actinophytocola sp.]|uniref:LysR family transcriptional regulator n=1 Tax=Actinophytocola sp. TaxID=1872138 RepID=UPI002DB666EE|nr:LysR family transcriptional regulator [Actinophytocola sp.]
MSGKLTADPGQLPLDELDLLVLKGVAETASIPGAARAAGLSPSVAVRRLGKLERRLDAALVRGDAERVRVTAAGRTVLAAGASLVGAVAAAAARVSDMVAGRPTGIPRLRLAGFGRNWDEFADELAAHVPGMLLEVTNREPAVAVELYDRHEADAVYAWQVPGRPLVPTRPAAALTVLDEPLWVALPASHPSAGRSAVSLRALAADRWISGPTEQARQLIHAVCTAEGFAPHLGYTADSGATGRSMISHAVGVALVSPLTVPSANNRSGIVVRPLRNPPRRRLMLSSDPTLIDERLARILVHRLRTCYVSAAAVRNPGYRNGPDFPIVAPDPARAPDFDPELLAGLRSVDAGCTASGDPRRLGLADLHLLRVVCATGSLNRAARILLISQPALSRRIHRLERALGMGLFVRSYRGTELSPAARNLLSAVAGPEAAFRATLMSIRYNSDPPGTPGLAVPSHSMSNGMG